MGEHFDPGRYPDRDPDRDRLDRIDRELQGLGRQLEALRDALGRELRTRRIVVEEEDGFERVVISARGAFGFVAVQARASVRSDDRGATSAELFANDAVDADGPHVGVSLSDRGDVVATVDRLEGHRARVWLADPT